VSIARTRGILYVIARLLGDVQAGRRAARTGSLKPIAKRIARRAAGRATGTCYGGFSNDGKREP